MGTTKSSGCVDLSIDIIIPYFQRTPGILVETIRSVLAQTATDWHLIVVDDGSPHPARNELEALTDEERVNIRIIEQPNGGVSVARNRGLDAVRRKHDLLPSSIPMIAGPQTISRMPSQHCKQMPISFGVRSQPMARSIPIARRAKSSLQTSANQPSWTKFTEAIVFVRFLAGEWWRHMHLSTIVLRAEHARKLRFNSNLRSSEDFDFFKRVADMRLRAAFSDAVSVTRGVGDNIWHNLDFSDERVAQERFNTFRLLTALLKDSALTDGDKEVLQWRRNVAREQFVWTQYLRRQNGERLNLGLIMKWIASDPVLLWTLYRLKSNPNASAQNTGIPEPDVSSEPQ